MNGKKVWFYNRYTDLDQWQINCNHHHLKIFFWWPLLWPLSLHVTWWWGHYTLQHGLTTLPHSLLSQGNQQDVLCSDVFRKTAPQEKVCCQKIRWARKAGNQIWFFCRLKSTRHILPAPPHQNCGFAGVLTHCNKWRPLYQVRDKCTEKALQVSVKRHLTMLMVTKYVKVSSKGVPRTKRDKEKTQFYRDFIENIRQI
jgi:hypothetical protein